MRSTPTDAYGKVNKMAITPRAAEAEAFSKAARLLQQARQNTFDYDSYASALRFNQELWTLIQNRPRRTRRCPPASGATPSTSACSSTNRRSRR